MTNLLRSAVFVLAGLGIAKVFNVNHLESSSTYLLFASCLLAIGLYASTFGIDLVNARRDARTIFIAVTVGVFLKTALIAVPLYLLTHNPMWLILGVVVAQIDPLSVAAIMAQSRMSSRAKSLIAAWSSFDDPITVLLTFYLVPVVAGLLPEAPNLVEVTQLSKAHTLDSFVENLGLNGLFVAVALVGWRLLRTRSVQRSAAIATVVTCLVFSGLLVIAVQQFLMLGLAVVGLFFRPRIGAYIGRAVNIAFCLASVALGMLLVRGVDVVGGLVLALAAFGSQIAVGFLLTGKLPRSDRVHIAFAQQNGITAIILALLLEADFHGIVGVVAPAIFFVNAMNLLSNRIIDRSLPA